MYLLQYVYIFLLFLAEQTNIQISNDTISPVSPVSSLRIQDVRSLKEVYYI